MEEHLVFAGICFPVMCVGIGIAIVEWMEGRIALCALVLLVSISMGIGFVDNLAAVFGVK